MKTTCPACGAVASLDVLIELESARTALLVALAMPAPLGKLLVQYLALFRPAQRQLSFDRVANLLNELLPQISAARIERNGRTWSAPQDYWQMALTEMISKRDSLTLPLKSHGYLLAIIEGYSIKVEARKEQQHEDRLAGRTPVGGQIPPIPPLTKGGADGLPLCKRGIEGDLKPRTQMPQTVKAALKKGGIDDGNNQ